MPILVRGIDHDDNLRDNAVTNIADEDPGTEWTQGSTFDTGDEVWLASTRRKYRSAVDNNTANPATGVIADPPTWVDIGPTNRSAMFDSSTGSRTTAASPLTVQFSATDAERALTGAAFIGLDADQVTVYCTSAIAGGEFFRETLSLTSFANITNHYQYRYGPFIKRRKRFFPDWNYYSDTVVNVEITSSSGTVSVTVVSIGENLVFGELQSGATSEPRTRGSVRGSGANRRYVATNTQWRIRGQVKIGIGLYDYTASIVADRLRGKSIALSADPNFDSYQTFGPISMVFPRTPALDQKANFVIESAE